MDAILSGIRILDFTRVLAGPYTTMVLADFGAEVIKVQSQKTSGPQPNSGGYFEAWNRNKRSITLDMTHPEARALALKLVSICDVVIENFSPRVMSNWGMEFETLNKIHPDLIMLSMSGMGQTGPWKNHVAYGPTVQSLGGLTYLSSFEADHPLGPGYALADHISGLYGAVAVLAALEHRGHTGMGQYIDLSQYEVVASMIGPSLLDTLANNRESTPQGNQPDYEIAAPHGCYPCRGDDRWCVIAAFNESEWQALVRLMSNPGWAFEKRFATLEARKRHFKSLDEKLVAWTKQHDARELVKHLQEAGIQAGLVQNAADLAKDPHLLDQDYFVPAPSPSLGEYASERSPIRFIREAANESCPDAGFKAAPDLGEANEYVYKELIGMTEQEYRSSIRHGIIA